MVAEILAVGGSSGFGVAPTTLVGNGGGRGIGMEAAIRGVRVETSAVCFGAAEMEFD